VTPISEQIMENVVATLATVTLVGGYDNDLTVIRPVQRPDSITDGMCVVGAGDPIPANDPPCGFDEFVLPVGVTVFCIEDENSPTPIQTRLYSIAADVRRALKRDVHRGGLAVLTEFDVKDELHELNAPPAVVVYANVRFRTLYADPYRQS
jgi:hypothetical protein